MISAFWLLLLFPAFWLGFFTAALLTMARRQDDVPPNSDRSLT